MRKRHNSRDKREREREREREKRMWESGIERGERKRVSPILYRTKMQS